MHHTKRHHIGVTSAAILIAAAALLVGLLARRPVLGGVGAAGWLVLPLVGCGWQPSAPIPPDTTPSATPTPRPTASPTSTSGATATPTAAPSPQPLLAVDDFCYQLQAADLQAIARSAFDMVVIDYSSTGDAHGEYTAAQIASLRANPAQPKIVLSYLSIGEAEDYRFYWHEGWAPGNPAWLDAENPDWGGNYKVRYWDPAWRGIVMAYLDRILDAGYDGVYLDIIDAYEYYFERGRASAPAEMAALVGAIRDHAHARAPGFVIVVQNAPELAEIVPGYMALVDGIGQEDIYYGYEEDDVATPSEDTQWLEGHLDRYVAAHKLVLTIDYCTTPAHIDDAYARSAARGYVPYCTVRDLDQLTVNPGHEPD